MRWFFPKMIGYSTLVMIGLAGSAAAQLAAPTLTIEPPQPRGLDDVTLIGSGFSGTGGAVLSAATFQLAADADFTKIYLVFTNSISADGSTPASTRYVVENDRFPANRPLYARVQYQDSLGNVSAWSDGVTITLGDPPGLKLIYSNDFESVPVDTIPEGWEVFTTTDDTGPQGSYYYPELRQWVVKDVEFLNTLLYYPSYGDPSVVETELKIADGHTLVADSGDYVDAQNFFETHIITHEFDFTGITDIVVAFNSNYIQNQDNIAMLEYTTDNGTVDITAGAGITGWPVGTWYPVLYYLDRDRIIYDETGAMNIPATLEGRDDKGFSWYEYIFADETVGDEEVAKHILPRLDDPVMGPGGVNGEYDSKRWERFRIPHLDNQPSIKFRFAFQGSWSWFWTIDNFQIWGNDGTSVSDWALY
ncbi:MAG: hypothetical protein HPY51_06080 [Candidatus Omnitrophica bacterium]|nr:hypothetical protein [Candidatus Omnitrophota bacterium]